MSESTLNAILLLYHHPLQPNAPTIMEYVNAFTRHSRFPVFAVNTEFGFPSGLRRYRFQSIVMHYSLFGAWPYKLDRQYYNYIAASSEAYKVAIFQDEYRYCQPRFRFINDYQIDCVYTCIAPEYIEEFYGKYTHAPRIVSVLTGYVSEEILQLANQFVRPDHKRIVDIGYRGRPLPFYLGQGAREKTEIAEGFRVRAQELDLKLDIKIEEEDRFYGTDWYQFLSNCKGVLGVESGTSFCDVEDRVRPAVDAMLAANPAVTFDEVYNKILQPWEGRIPIRTISPRHFEAAAFRVCQILYEGNYAGILKPMEHYLPLKKDFSNFQEVIRLFRDREVRKRLTDNAYRDLIASGHYTFKSFIEALDKLLLENGLTTTGEDEAIITDLNTSQAAAQKWSRRWKTAEAKICLSPFVQTLVKPILRPILVKVRGSRVDD